jgi:ABC-type transport system involved in cytochrome bd biosynthesis fused ATPase/permease subunit
LTLGEAGYDDQRLLAALAQAGLGAVVAQLPEGLATVLGEAGRGLSGGQLQRLALARALLRDAPLWLLDEPTAQLDADTSAGLRAVPAGTSRGRSVLLATHDRAHLDWVDRVLVLQQGRLVEQGTPAALVQRPDSWLRRLYSELEE